MSPNVIAVSFGFCFAAVIIGIVVLFVWYTRRR